MLAPQRVGSLTCLYPAFGTLCPPARNVQHNPVFDSGSPAGAGGPAEPTHGEAGSGGRAVENGAKDPGAPLPVYATPDDTDGVEYATAGAGGQAQGKHDHPVYATPGANRASNAYADGAGDGAAEYKMLGPSHATGDQVYREPQPGGASFDSHVYEEQALPLGRGDPEYVCSPRALACLRACAPQRRPATCCDRTITRLRGGCVRRSPARPRGWGKSSGFNHAH